MKKLMLIAAAAALTLGQPALAEDKVDQATQDKLIAQLKSDGYEVRKVQMEDGLIEAYTLKEGKKYEMYFDASLKLVETKEGDD